MTIINLKRTLIHLALLSIFSNPLHAQNWQNPAERYLEAYKKYLKAACPIAEDSIQHFVYFSRDRAAIVDHPFLHHPRFKGAQIMYSWKELEPEKGGYQFSQIEADLKYLEQFDKKLFIQLQDATFDPKYQSVPDYLLSGDYDGGAVLQYHDDDQPEGWVAKRWNQQVRLRFAALLAALGEAFHDKIAGINLQETAIGVSTKSDPSFSEAAYVQGLKENMAALKKAFPETTTMIYANFMPGEWLPWEDKGHLRSIYEYGNQIGVGLGAPDLMVTRKGQLNHPLAMMHEYAYEVPLGIAVQDGNYIGQTGADSDYVEELDNGTNHHGNIVPLLQAFAKDFLKVSYMFWVNQTPYFEEDVLPCFDQK